MNKQIFEPIIGLEIHVELKTNSKMFCGCNSDYFGHQPNTHCCPVCLGLPGALPVVNKRAIEWCLKLGMALNCRIPEFSKFDRKNYFYPDLPKGYQISQYDNPFCINGWLDIKSQNSKRIRIQRVHMEEDTGKLIHTKINGEDCTLIDFNRSGVPLLEIVTEPDIRGSGEAKVFLQELQMIIRYLDISDADMEKGSMRLEPNISLKVTSHKSQVTSYEEDLPKYKVEVKNINSFNFVKRAIDYEITRQIALLKNGEIPVQETRGWDEKQGITYSQRSKEEAHDYRYFPEPDIPPFIWKQSYLHELKKQLPELPEERRERFIKDFHLKTEDIEVLVETREKADYLEKAVDVVRRLKIGEITPQELANWIINNKVDIKNTVPADLVKLIKEKHQHSVISSDILSSTIKIVLKNNETAVADYRKGKQAVIMFLVGQVLKETRGKGKPEEIKKLLIEKLT